MKQRTYRGHKQCVLTEMSEAATRTPVAKRVHNEKTRNPPPKFKGLSDIRKEAYIHVPFGKDYVPAGHPRCGDERYLH